MQTGIKRIYAPQRAASAIGGLCKWWYVPVQAIASFRRIDPATQQYEQEPQLLPGYQWLGPIKVPDSKLGFTESQEGAKPGPWMKQQVVAYQPGDTPSNRILRQNIMHGEYVVVGKLRSNGMYLVIGTKDSGLSYDHTFKSGSGGNKSDSGTDFALNGESYYNAPVLTSFSQDVQSLVGLPNTVLFGFINGKRLPTTLEIETARSATFTDGGTVKADYTGYYDPQWCFVAELISQPVKTRYYVNNLSYGPIGVPGGYETWINYGTVSRTGGGLYRVYLTGFATAFPLQIVELIP